MHFLRPIAESDLPKLIALARSIDGGMTTLPPDAEFLRGRIDDSLHAFSPRIHKPGGEYYLFVLEDSSTGEVVGTSGIASRVGGFEPFYSYVIVKERLQHAPLGIDREVGVLHLKQVHRGPTEIGSLFLHPDHRRGGLGRLLSLSRFLFIGAFPARFDQTVIAELRGYIDQTGKSPFWEAVGRQFFGNDFYAADALSGLGNKEFIADLMPRHPIYIPLLPPEVQAVVGKVHHDTLPALALLTAEGFALTDEVDIFDAGPQVRVATNSIRTVAQRKSSRLGEIVLELAPEGDACLLANGRLDFRACLGAFTQRGDSLLLGQEIAEALQLKVGDPVVHAPVHSRSSP